MDVKLLEIRDRMTFIAAMAVRLLAKSERDVFLLRRAGYSREAVTFVDFPEPYVLLTRLDGGGLCEYDPYAWADRTMANAHKHIIERWHELKSGDVVDVEFVLGERPEPKRSEYEEYARDVLDPRD